MSESESKLGPWLIEHLTRLHMSPEQLGNKIGVSRASIYFYINDTTRPTRNNMRKICTVFGVDAEEAFKLYTIRPRSRAE